MIKNKRGYSRPDFKIRELNIAESKRSTRVCTQNNIGQIVSCKRSQEGLSSSGTAASIIIIAVLVVLLVLAVSGAFGDFFGIIGKGRGISAVGKSCLLNCENSDAAGFCIQPYDVKALEPGQVIVAGKKAADKNGFVGGVTCKELADAKLILTCPEIDCSNPNR